MRDSLAEQLSALIHNTPLTNPVQPPAAQFRARGNTMPIDNTPLVQIEAPQPQKGNAMPDKPNPTPEPNSGGGPKPPPKDPLPPEEVPE